MAQLVSVLTSVFCAVYFMGTTVFIMLDSRAAAEFGQEQASLRSHGSRARMGLEWGAGTLPHRWPRLASLPPSGPIEKCALR
mgnify:CR=1 FL=1